MEQSQDIALISAALVNFQANCVAAKTTSDNPFFKSKYSDLAEVWGTVRKPLTDAGLAVIQAGSTAGKVVTVETMLLHTSGQWFKFGLSMPCEKETPQAIGSCITYGRRYGMCAILGVSQEDDDGNAASGPGKHTAQPETKTETKAPPISLNAAAAAKEAERVKGFIKKVELTPELSGIATARKALKDAKFSPEDESIIQVAISSREAMLKKKNEDLPFPENPNNNGGN